MPIYYKCPYCYERLNAKDAVHCPHCHSYLVDDVVAVSYPSVESKSCLFCGKKILKEARFCRHCRKWLDEIQKAADEIDPKDLV